MNARRPMLADVMCEVARLREQLELERAARKTAESYVTERGRVIRQLEEAVEVFKSRCEELASELAATQALDMARLPHRLALAELYRQILTEIEHAMHRLPSGCTFGHAGQDTPQ